MAKIQTIKNKDNVTIYPQTHSTAVFANDGEKLQDKLDKYLTAEDQAEIENIGQTAETTNNKTTVINEISTNEQYPSAKAVYDAIMFNSSNGGVKIEIAVNKGAIISPNTTTIYLIGEEAPYEEYLYLGNGKWELIGTTQVDLSDYYTKTEADEKYAKLNLYGDTTINIGRKADTTIGLNSVAEGYGTTASGSYSHAEGYNTTASGDFSSHAEGYNTTASGQHSHAEGINTTASGSYSHAEGYGTIAKLGSHAEGYGTTAKNDFSHAEGNTTTASGYTSHAEGSNTTASGPCSHAESYKTEASGSYSHAEGLHTKAASTSQHVQGEYNIEDSNDTYAHIVGNGSSDAERSNAHTLAWTGEAWYQGDVYVGSTSGTNKDEGSKKLATEEYVDTNPNLVKNSSATNTMINYIWTGTQEQYEALPVLDANTIYNIIEA